MHIFYFVYEFAQVHWIRKNGSPGTKQNQELKMSHRPSITPRHTQ